MIKTKLWQRWVYTGVCLAALLAIFISWWHKTPPAGLPAAVSSIAITVLFAILGIRFIPQWMEAWSGVSGGETKAKIDKWVYLKIFGLLLLSRLIVLAIALIMRFAILGYGDISDAVHQIWTYGDGYHYIDIAKYWYRSEGYIDDVVRLVFLPFYPILIRAAAGFIGDYFLTAMLISHLAFSLAGCVMYRVARFDMDHDDAIRSVRILALLPSALFYAAPMSDSLFLLLSVVSIYFMRKKNYFAASLIAGLASFTRSLGLTLFAPICFELIADTVREIKNGELKLSRTSGRVLSLALIPLGFCVYLYINYVVSGNPFQYLIYQYEHWGQELGWFFNTVSYMVYYGIEYFKEGTTTLVWGLSIPNLTFIFGSLAVLAARVKKLRPSYTAYSIAYFVIAIGATWLLSAPRYLASLFPVSFALSGLVKNKAADWVLSNSLLLASLFYIWAFVNNWCVY